MNLDEILKALGVHLDSPEKRASFMSALQRDHQSTYQMIFDKGFASGSAGKNQKLTETESLLATRDQELASANAKIKTLEGEQPKTAELRKQHETEIADLKATHKTAIEAKDAKITKTLKGTARAEFKAKLIALGTDPDYAELRAQGVDGRFTWDEDGTRRVLKADSQIQLQVAEGVDPLDALAKEHFDTVPAKFKSASVAGGSGSQGDSQGGGGGNGEWGKFRENIEKSRKESPIGIDNRPLAEKLKAI